MCPFSKNALCKWKVKLTFCIIRRFFLLKRKKSADHEWKKVIFKIKSDNKIGTCLKNNQMFFPNRLGEVLDNLEANHDFLLKGDVFTGAAGMSVRLVRMGSELVTFCHELTLLKFRKKGGGKLPHPLDRTVRKNRTTAICFDDHSGQTWRVLFAVKMWFQLCLGDIPRRLTENGFESSFIQFGMGGNCKRLFRTIRKTTNKLDMAALLTCYDEAEQRKYFDDVLTGESFQLRHGRGYRFRGWR